MPGFWARFLALDQTAGGGGRGVGGREIQFYRFTGTEHTVLQFYWDRKCSFTVLQGQKNTVLQGQKKREKNLVVFNPSF